MSYKTASKQQNLVPWKRHGTLYNSHSLQLHQVLYMATTSLCKVTWSPWKGNHMLASMASAGWSNHCSSMWYCHSSCLLLSGDFDQWHNLGGPEKIYALPFSSFPLKKQGKIDSTDSWGSKLIVHSSKHKLKIGKTKLTNKQNTILGIQLSQPVSWILRLN